MLIATCPSSAGLERLCQNGLPESEAIALEQHVHECRPCLERLMALLPAHDTLTDALAGRDTLTSPASAHPLVADLIRKLENIKLPSKPLKTPEVRMLAFNCSSCQKKLSVKENLVGKKVKCPGCGQLTAVPAAIAVGVMGNEDLATLPPNSEPSANVPSQPDASAAPTHSSLETPDATMGVAPDSGPNSSLIDFLATN